MISWCISDSLPTRCQFPAQPFVWKHLFTVPVQIKACSRKTWPVLKRNCLCVGRVTCLPWSSLLSHEQQPQPLPGWSRNRGLACSPTTPDGATRGTFQGGSNKASIMCMCPPRPSGVRGKVKFSVKCAPARDRIYEGQMPPSLRSGWGGNVGTEQLWGSCSQFFSGTEIMALPTCQAHWLSLI